jgi:hypothetical protein
MRDALAAALHREFCPCGEIDLSDDFHGPAHRARFLAAADSVIATLGSACDTLGVSRTTLGRNRT